LNIPTGWQVDIGLEIHAQLSTEAKIFSGASTTFGNAPNSQACAIDLGMPGVLPKVNAAAYEKAVRFGLGVSGTINRESRFDRKNYFYPDLPKGYQITQMDLPIVVGGHVTISNEDGTQKVIHITRAHLEEDAGKSIHDFKPTQTGVDLNRAGTPLLEIVSEPDLKNASEAVAYAKAIHHLLTYLDVCDGNMAEGSLRFDANISVRRVDAEALGVRSRPAGSSLRTPDSSILKNSKPGRCVRRKPLQIIGIFLNQTCCPLKLMKASSTASKPACPSYRALGHPVLRQVWGYPPQTLNCWRAIDPWGIISNNWPPCQANLDWRQIGSKAIF
jgi:hypothetical protein